MTEILTPQEPDDRREVARGIDAEGKLVFRQVGFEELNFGAVFGGKTTSTTENTIGYGLRTFSLDVDDGKVLVGHTVQITSLDDVDCFMYGVVLRKDMAASPAQIEVAIHTTSNAVITSSNWEIQIVEVSRNATRQIGDSDVELEDHDRIVFLTEALTAPRTLTLSTGETLIPGTRVLLVDAVLPQGTLSPAHYLNVYDQNGTQQILMFHPLSSQEFIWNGASWSLFNYTGYAFGLEPDSSPLLIEEFDDSAAKGPNITLLKTSASPAAGDGIGGINFSGGDSGGGQATYALTYGRIVDPTAGSQDGEFVVNTVRAGANSDVVAFRQGQYMSGATGGDPGAGKINATDYQINGVPLSTNFQGKDATLTALAAFNTNGLVTQSAADTFAGRTIAGPAAGISITNGNGVAGNPTIGLANDLAALEGLGSTGLAVRTAADIWAQRSIAAGTNIAVTNGDGILGNPTIDVSPTIATWTPTVTFATPGNLAVSYSVRYGGYIRVGKLIIVNFNIQTSTFTHTTAFGNLQITGLPATSQNVANDFAWGTMEFRGITKAGFTQFAATVSPNDNKIIFVANASGSLPAALTTTDVPSGGTVWLIGTIAYVA